MNSSNGDDGGILGLRLSNKPVVEGCIGKAAARLERLDILVNNAGIVGASKPTHEPSQQEWGAVQGVNVKGVCFGVKHAKILLSRSGAGSINNLSSIYGLASVPDVPPYHASKGANRLMT
jgi:NAD(P)-dependent dehydrogenase (short-subunit alcohol dehydrogenase family)